MPGGSILTEGIVRFRSGAFGLLDRLTQRPESKRWDRTAGLRIRQRFAAPSKARGCNTLFSARHTGINPTRLFGPQTDGCGRLLAILVESDDMHDIPRTF
jgi:hypothetical protein